MSLVGGDAVGVGLDADDRATGTLASAIACTFERASPVSNVSSLRWLPHGLCAVAPGGADRAAGTAAGTAAAVVAVVVLDAAEAMP